jgi:AraC-like DNA-binding protein
MLVEPSATTKEWVKVWRDPAMPGLELRHATYITHAFSRHMHDYYALGVIETGKQTFWYRGARHATPPGDVFVINPGEVHTGEAADNYGFTYRTFYPEVAFLQRVSSEIAGSEQHMPFFPMAVIHDAHLTELMCSAHSALLASLSPLECESRFLHAFAYLITRYAEIRPVAQALGHERHAIQQVRHYIDEYYMQGVTLTELAQLVNLSPYYLLRVFEKEVGITPHAYLESVRIRQAQRLLTQGIPLVQVAYDLGFSHQSHFTNRFKRLLGITPGQYLQQRNILQDKQKPSVL